MADWIACGVADELLWDKAHILTPVMEQNEVSQLMLDIERSMQMRKMLHDKLARQEDVDLVDEWNAIEQLDLEISRKIRKHRLE